ncbi:MAG: fatty acyl-AMP ligase [Proteobacteria bacterium]|nr:fatty acyl-AMP ligase [Pseudomonadota bacterium]
MTSIRRPLSRTSDRASKVVGPNSFFSGQPMPAQHERYVATLRRAIQEPDRPTPTRNAYLPFKRGGFNNLCDALDYAATGNTGLNFFDARGRLLSVLPYSRLQLEAQALASRLIGADFGRGECLLIIADTSPDFCVAFFGAQYAGIIPVPVAVPVGLGTKSGYIEQLRRQIVACGAIAIVAPGEFVEFARAAASGTTARFTASLSDFLELPASESPLRPFQAGESCYVQFSSGSTRTPQGVDIRQDQLMANIDGSLAAQEVSEIDAGVSWLPLYHDMGLVGFILAPMCAQRSIDLMAPHDFARRPLQWLSMISRRRASITYSPGFGYDLVVRRASTQTLDHLDLSSLRLAGVGADMIQPAILDRFARTFAPNGFDPNAFMASYGMAEVCVGLSFGRPLSGIKVDTFADPQTGKDRDFVVCGHVLSGHRVEIRDEEKVLGERKIGRIFVQGPSVMPGYFRQGASPVHDGWLDTGDLGYWRGDELVISGRAKDLIIVNGRNIWPQDIEGAIENLSCVRRGECCAFSVEDGESEKVIVMVEGRPADPSVRESFEGQVRQAVKETVGIDVRVILIGRQPGLPRTSSGKLSRSRARAQFLESGGARPRNLNNVVHEFERR